MKHIALFTIGFAVTLLAISLSACSPRLNNQYYNQHHGLSDNPTIEQVIATRS